MSVDFVDPWRDSKLWLETLERNVGFKNWISITYNTTVATPKRDHWNKRKNFPLYTTARACFLEENTEQYLYLMERRRRRRPTSTRMRALEVDLKAMNYVCHSIQSHVTQDRKKWESFVAAPVSTNTKYSKCTISFVKANHFSGFSLTSSFLFCERMSVSCHVCSLMSSYHCRHWCIQPCDSSSFYMQSLWLNCPN